MLGIWAVYTGFGNLCKPKTTMEATIFRNLFQDVIEVFSMPRLTTLRYTHFS